MLSVAFNVVINERLEILVDFCTFFYDYYYYYYYFLTTTITPPPSYNHIFSLVAVFLKYNRKDTIK